MARRSFKDRFLTPQVAKAIMSPLGIVLFGVGTAGAVLVGAPLVAAAGVGALVWGGRVLAAVPRDAAHCAHVHGDHLSHAFDNVAGPCNDRDRHAAG